MSNDNMGDNDYHRPKKINGGEIPLYSFVLLYEASTIYIFPFINNGELTMLIAIIAELIIVLIILLRKKKNNSWLWLLFIIVGVINIIDAMR